MKRILITGGTGFVGSHLCERLLNKGNNGDRRILWGQAKINSKKQEMNN
jgi:UDP-glucose 4-epimerase